MRGRERILRDLQNLPYDTAGAPNEKRISRQLSLVIELLLDIRDKIYNSTDDELKDAIEALEFVLSENEQKPFHESRGNADDALRKGQEVLTKIKGANQ